MSALLLVLARVPLKKFVHTDIKDLSPESVPILIRLRDSMPVKMTEYNFDLFLWGIVLGAANFGIVMGQQLALYTVDAGKASFIYGLYVVFTPFCEWMLPNASPVSFVTFFAVFLSAVGTYFLSNCNFNNFGAGEIYLTFAMLCCVISILATDAGCKRVDCIDLSLIEFAVTTILCAVSSMLFESSMWIWPFTAVACGWKLILFVGLTEAVSYTLDTLGQMYTTATRASLIMSLDSVTTAIMGYFFLGEIMSTKEIFGSTLMLIATVLSTSCISFENQSVAHNQGANWPRHHIVPLRHRSCSFDDEALPELAKGYYGSCT
jgi:drug/metabolite transporter (DMT)-like permease